MIGAIPQAVIILDMNTRMVAHVLENYLTEHIVNVNISRD